MLIEAIAVSHATPLLHHVVPFNSGICRVTMPVVSDAEHVIRYLRWCEITKLLGVYAVKQFYHNETSLQEFENLIESYVIH